MSDGIRITIAVAAEVNGLPDISRAHEAHVKVSREALQGCPEEDLAEGLLGLLMQGAEYLFKNEGAKIIKDARDGG